MEKMLICQFYADIGPDPKAGTWFSAPGRGHPSMAMASSHPIPSDVGFVRSVVIKIVSITLCWFRAFIQADCRLPLGYLLCGNLISIFFYSAVCPGFFFLPFFIAISTSLYLTKKQFLYFYKIEPKNVSKKFKTRLLAF